MITKENLKEMSGMLGFSIPTKFRKELYAKSFSAAILESPKYWLAQLTQYELTLLRKLVDAGPNAYVEEPMLFFESTLEDYSFVIMDPVVEERKVRYMICDELREAIAPHLDEFLSPQAETIHPLIEQCVLGLVNLYGFLPIDELLDKLGECLQGVATEEECYASMIISVLIRRYMFELDAGLGTTVPCLESPLLYDFDRLGRDLSQHPGITQKKQFTKEQVLAAGDITAMRIPCPCSDELKKYMMNRLGYSERMADYQLFHLWFSMQTDEQPMSVINPLIGGKLSSIQELQEAIGLFLAYCNQCPRWFLKGYSSEEIFELEKDQLKKSPPQIVAGSNMKEAGMGFRPNAIADQKIGRNDPCPCGSGKKFKKCCGNN